ncbi:hypothetical protein BW38_01969 [Stenotrophomonas sp. RIT309]|jgi:hypothetical protein|uniref:hypothetical protein n=1 Tax=Stenotrophomonas sp. RIT309 TaxID=1470590 RepID=UPI00044AC65D|nr:hypothetical protein [Stenotrophomonas sp. RIT309]EZP45516.1 hypothetical protein BW38_01969 [Stenotrophomonas sp. RIT309]
MKAWFLVVVALCPAAMAAAADGPMRIDVAYDWSGWGGVSEHWLIERDVRGITTRVRVTDSAGSQELPKQILPAAAVEAFEAAIDAAPLSKEATISLIAGRLDRAEMLELDPKLRSMPPASCTFADQQAWARRTLTVQGLQQRVQQHFRGDAVAWTDDYPVMSVTVKRQGKPDVVFLSRSQKALMLPWKQLSSGQVNQRSLSLAPDQWRPALSDALTRLLPEGEATRARFKSTWLQHRLKQELELEALKCTTGP